MTTLEEQKRIEHDGIRFKLQFLEQDDYSGFLEAYSRDRTMELMVEILDQEKFIKRNDVQEITDPVFFTKPGVPSPKGLLSNEIFGITKEERAGIYGYIDLHGTYIDPSIYKAMIKVEPKIKNIVHGIGKWAVTDKGELVEAEKGDAGIDFIKRNITKIRFKKNDSQKRNLRVDYINRNIDKAFIKKLIVIPAYYRDINSTGANTGVGFINKMYSNLISMSTAPSEENYYGLSRSHAISGRIQETILAIYDYLSGNTNSMIGPNDGDAGLQGKFGVIRRSVMSKTTDYSCRLVISAPDMKGEHRSDIMVDLDHAAIPLSAAMTCFYPYMLFNVKRFFEKEFSANELYECVGPDGKVKYMHVKDPLIEFSDERITAEMKKFLHGYSNRFIPIEVPLEEKTKEKYYMAFKGRGGDPETAKDNQEAIYKRPLTWCDVFYMAAVEACRDKYVLVTRYPMDSRYNRFPVGLVVASTIKTENMMVGDTHYQYYPKIRMEDIGTNTSTTFVDTFVMSNLYLGAIGGDYDGDTVTLKGVYTVEANEELKAYANTKANFVDLGGNIIRDSSKEAIISMYALTMKTDNIMDGVLTKPEF